MRSQSRPGAKINIKTGKRSEAVSQPKGIRKISFSLRRKGMICRFLCDKEKASVSVYMIIITVLTLVLVCTLVESGRVSAVKAGLRSITYMAADSVFSEYARPVYDDYGIMLLWRDEEKISEKLETYINDNLNASKASILPAADLCGAKLESLALTDISWAVDENGKDFEEQIYDHMKFYITQETAEKLVSKLGVIDSGQKVRNFMKKISSFNDVFTKAQGCAEKINKSMAEVKELAEKTVEIIKNMEISAEEFLKTGDMKCIEEIRKDTKKLKEARRDISDFSSRLETEKEAYNDIAGQIKETVQTLQSELEKEKDGYDEESYKLVEDEIKKLGDNNGPRKDGYSMAEKLAVTDNLKEKADAMETLFPKLDEDNIEKNISDISNMLSECRRGFEEIDSEKLKPAGTSSQSGDADLSFIPEIGKIINEGVLSYVAGEVSQKSIDISDFPSVTCSRETPGDGSEEKLLEATAKKAMLSEYVLTHTGNFANAEGNNALDYETEYIIAGKDSDRDNLASVADRLILLRSGCNLISILKDGEKRAEAAMAAAAIATALCIPEAEQPAELIILCAWAAAEAVVDVKMLLDNEKVPVIKQSREWNLSLTGLRNFAKSGITGKGTENGLTYKEYLRVLLLTQNKQKQVYRVMDVIQADMCLKENPAFRIKDCILKLEVSAGYEAPGMFVSFPFVKKHIGHGGGYSFVLDQNYSY